MTEPRCIGGEHEWGSPALWGEGTAVRATQVCSTCGVVRVHVTDRVRDVDRVEYWNV